MADDPSTPAQPQDPNPQPDNPIPQPNQTDPVPAPAPAPASTPPPINPNPNPNPAIPPPQVSFSASFPVPPSAPSFRPLPQFTPISNYTNPPGVQPPGVTSGAPMVPGAPVPPPQQQQQPVMHYQMPPQMRPYAPMPNGYPQGTVPPPGLLRYPSPYPAMLRPGFPPRPIGGIGLLPVQRPPMIGIPGVRPILPPAVRPALPIVTPAEKPQTTVYVGKIAPTVDNDFMLYLLQLCGPVKNWKRPQDPTDGTPRAFGFCEFESAEGVLRALRLLSKFNIDGQDLVLNVNQGTREYLERFVKKRTENLKKQEETQAEEVEKEGESTVEKPVLADTAVPDLKEDSNSGNKETNSSNFGIVTDEDREADREAMEKLTSLIEERLKTNPLPPPPPLAPGDGTGNSNSELPTKSRDGDSDVDTRNDASEAKNDEETTSYNRAASEQDRPETSSPDRSRKPEKSRERERDRDLKQEKEREIERYERETERERIRKEREQRRKIEDAERKFEECLKDWEYREREKHKQRQYEKEREKDRDRKRKNTVIYEEEDEDEDSRKRWRRNTWEEKKKRRQREMDDDYADRLLEEKEIADANRVAEYEKKLQDMRDALKISYFQIPNGREEADEESCVELKDMAMEQDNESDYGHRNHIGDGTLQNGKTGDESTVASVSAPELQQSGSAPTKKLGFGLVGSGKRTSVPSVFKEEDDDAHKDKKMRPLVPIDYSTEELQAVQPAASVQAPSNLAAAAEFAKQISNVSSKDEKYDAEKERNRRANDRSSHRDRDRNDDDNNRSRDENKEKIGDRDSDREHGRDKPRTTDNKKLLDAKQLIDMIPRTKEELFSYEINWAIYEKHALHERMKPWISKKITEFLGEEETTLVDYIVSSTKEHVGAERMLQLLQAILDEEAEMFVLKMWRMLIFEIKKVETGLPSKTRS